jgi:hypothetical protein
MTGIQIWLGFGLKPRREETTWKTHEEMEGWDESDGVRLPSQHCDPRPVVLSPDDKRCGPVSKWDWLRLTPNLSTRALWPVPETTLGVSCRGRRKWEFSLFIPVGLKEFLTHCRILQHGFRLYFPFERKVCCGFVSPLKIHRLGWVQTHDLWVQWQAH